MSEQSYISHPVTALSGDITVPGDKSISHRAIMLGAIARGTTEVDGFLDGDDCLATISAFQSMGVRIEYAMNQSVIIQGVGKHGLKKTLGMIDCGNSGTTMRLLTGILAGQSFDSQLTGDQSLLKRPMNRVALPLMQMGADIHTHDGRAPLWIYGKRAMQGISYRMPQASAQVKSSILFAGLYAAGVTTVIEPHLTRDHTERMLRAFSYPFECHNGAISIHAASECMGTSIRVPGDFSSAAFFIVAATIIPGSLIKINSVGINPTRTGLLELLKQMGANIQILNKRSYGEEPVADLMIKYAPLSGIEVPSDLVALTIDEFPIFFIAAACAKGITLLRGAEELRWKESDRIAAMAEGLRALGIEVVTQQDGMMIHGGAFSGGLVKSYDDHRIAMAFSIAGAVATSAVTIQNCNNIATSFPNFLHTANQINLNIQYDCDRD